MGILNLVNGDWSDDKSNVMDRFSKIYKRIQKLEDGKNQNDQENKNLKLSVEEKQKQIDHLIAQDQLKEKAIQLLKTQVDELQRFNAPASCMELKMQGINRNQEVYLDGDGTTFGQVPIKVKCTFPDAKITFGEKTIVHDQLDFVLENEMVTQINSLIEASSSCSQSFQFDCTSFPLKHPTTNGDLLFWKDKAGNTNVLEPSGYTAGECNGTIIDKTKLPMSGVFYKKINNVSAKIIVDPLICSPPESKPATSTVITTVTTTTTTTTTTTAESGCPTSDSRYHIVDGICLYYEKTYKNFADAKANCETKFNGNGRLFEPKSVAINRKVHKTGRDNNFGYFFWIGVKANKYASDGSQISISPPWYSSYRKIDQCLLYCAWGGQSYGQWCDLACTRSYSSVCEHN